MTSYQKYLKAEKNINEGLIRFGLSIARPEGYVRSPKRRMDAMRSFLKSCGDPQTNLPAVHVAGTSGKGSVCAAIAGILKEAGLNVGLHISPYLQSATEKIWINDKLISAKQFEDLVDWVMPIAQPLVHPDTPASIHGMASVAIALEAFRRANLDVIVFEAGCGARYDLTSFVDTKTSVITNVGLDHIVSLGPEIEQIAWHKAGVAREGIPLVTGACGSALDVIKKEATIVNAPLKLVPKTSSAFAHNRDIAVAASKEIADHLGVKLTSKIVQNGLKRVRLPARSEEMPSKPGEPRVVLDGAHNAEKLTVAVAGALDEHTTGPKVALIGFLGAKANEALLEPLKGIFDLAVATEPRVYGKTACPVDTTMALLKKTGINALAEPDPLKALKMSIDAAGPDGTVLIVGSFYLAGELRECWFTKKNVVLQQTSWPDNNV